MDQTRIQSPSKERIRDTLLACNKSFRLITDEIPMCRTALMNIIDLKNYTFQNYEKIIAYCRQIAPTENWSYLSLEELRIFFEENPPPRGVGLSKSIRKSFFAQQSVPKVDTYLILCNIKSKMEAENLCSK